LLHSEQASRIRVDEEHKTVPGRWSEQLTRISGQVRVSEALRLGASYDFNNVQINSVQRTSGKEEPFEGMRHRGELYAQTDFENGVQLRGSVYGAQSTIGGGFYFSMPDSAGRTSIQADFQRPFWEFVEGMVDDGVRDRLEIRRQLTLGRRISSWAAVSVNRYGISRDPNVAESIGGEGGFRFFILLTNPYLTLDYGFDGEYRQRIETRNSAAGLSFNPIPLLNREVHTLSAALGSEMAPNLRADGYGGFAYDRLGGKGPYFGVRLTYDTPSDFGAQLWFDRRLNTVNTGESINRFGGRLLWKF
jgi:hypothetical protein